MQRALCSARHHEHGNGADEGMRGQRSQLNAVELWSPGTEPCRSSLLRAAICTENWRTLSFRTKRSPALCVMHTNMTSPHAPLCSALEQLVSINAFPRWSSNRALRAHRSDRENAALCSCLVFMHMLASFHSESIGSRRRVPMQLGPRSLRITGPYRMSLQAYTPDQRSCASCEAHMIYRAKR